MAEKQEKDNALIEQLKAEYGLHIDPFSSGLSKFFGGGQRQHNLETMRHLAIFGDMVLLLTGEKGAGKSSLLQEFVRLHGDEVQTILLSAALGGGQSTCLTRLVALSGISFEEGENPERTLARLIQNYEAEYHQSGKRILWVIDDADQIPEEELQLFVAAFRGLPPESGIAVLFAGSPGLVDRLSGYGKADSNEWLHQIHVKPFSNAEALDYLEARLHAAGMSDELVLSDVQRLQLTEMGKGLPGRINRIFPAVLFGMGEFSSSVSQHSNNSVGQKVLFGLAGLLVLSFLFVSYQHGLFDSTGKESGQVSIPEKLRDEKEQKMVVADQRSEIADRVAKRLALLDQKANQQVLVAESSGVSSALPSSENSVAGDISEESELPGVSKENMLADSADNVESENNEGAVRQVSTEKERVIEVKAPAINAVKEDKPDVIVSGKHSSYRSAEWLLEKSKSGYTLQVLGSRNDATAIRYIESAKLSSGELVYLETTYKQAPWFVVLYGEYATKEAARKGAASAPKVVKKQQPWLRSFNSVAGSLPK